jgi:hypothetical protein
MSPDLALRATEPADLPALSALFERRFGHPLAAAEWEWKYRRISDAGPGEGRSLVAVAGGHVVAHAGALRLAARWRGEGGEVREGGLWQLADFAGEAGTGLRPPLVALGRRLLADLPGSDDAPWIFGFPSERHFRLGVHAFGYRPLATLQPLAGEIPRATASAAVDLAVSDSCGGWAEAIWARSEALGVRRSAAFLNWRYHARPERYYRFYRLSAPGGEGLLVFAFVGAEAWAAEVWLGSGAEWYPSLLAVAADLRASGLGTWRFWPGLPEPLPAALGLAPAGEPVFVGCRGRPGGPDPVLAARGFTIQMGDYDLV